MSVRVIPWFLPSVVASAALAFAALPVSPAAAKAGTCKKHSTQIARKGASALWLSANKKVLYGCTSFYDLAPHDEKLGPWSPQSKVVFTGSTALWTVRAGGKDRVWAADATTENGAWVRGARPAIGDGADDAVLTLKAYGDAAAWITTKGTVVMAVKSPNDDEPSPIGAGSLGALAPTAPSPTAPKPQGLAVDPVKPQANRVVVGRWGGLDVPTLAGTLSVTEGSGGDGDECGGVDQYVATVKPVDGQAAVGLSWLSSWSSTSGVCA